MGSDICFLVTILYEQELMKCAIKFASGVLSRDCERYPLEHKTELHSKLPLHMQRGPIVDVEQIFDVGVVI